MIRIKRSDYEYKNYLLFFCQTQDKGLNPTNLKNFFNEFYRVSLIRFFSSALSQISMKVSFYLKDRFICAELVSKSGDLLGSFPFFAHSSSVLEIKNVLQQS